MLVEFRKAERTWPVTQALDEQLVLSAIFVKHPEGPVMGIIKRKKKGNAKQKKSKHLLFHFNFCNQELGGIIPILQKQLQLRKKNGRVGFRPESLSLQNPAYFLPPCYLPRRFATLMDCNNQVWCQIQSTLYLFYFGRNNADTEENGHTGSPVWSEQGVREIHGLGVMERDGSGVGHWGDGAQRMTKDQTIF